MAPTGRRRSNTLSGGERPFDTPLNSEDQKLVALIDAINKKDAADKVSKEKNTFIESSKQDPVTPPLRPFSASVWDPKTPDDEVLASLGQSRSEWRAEFKPLELSPVDEDIFASTNNSSNFGRPQRVNLRESRPPRSSTPSPGPFGRQPYVAGSHTSQVQNSSPSSGLARKVSRIKLKEPKSQSSVMNYQGYGDGSGGGANPRQAPSPQGMNHANGINGAVGMPAMMAGLPTPAGHQSDLNYIQQMVEQLSAVLEENRLASERITVSADRVRERAMEMDMSNDEMIKEVSAALNESSIGLEEENSRLRKELDHARFEEQANLDLCRQFQKQMANMIEQAHTFKLKTTEDMCAWHRSYRNQLAEEREKNLALTCQILDMQEHAARGMECLRKFRRAWEDNPFHHELQVQIVHKRQEARMWKRLALRELADDDSEFSDDSDIIDPVEKKRLAQVEADKVRARKAEQKEAASNAGGPTSGLGGAAQQ